MRRKTYRYYRHPRTTAERRANENCEFARAKRKGHNLPNPWDDIPVSKPTKSWKDRRRKQYREGGRGKEYSIFIPAETRWGKIWHLKEYFEEHEIPYSIETKKESWIETVTFKWDRDLLRYSKNESGIGLLWRPVFSKWYKVPIESYQRKRTKTVGYIIRWWSHKDIGIEFILNSYPWPC